MFSQHLNVSLWVSMDFQPSIKNQKQAIESVDTDLAVPLGLTFPVNPRRLPTEEFEGVPEGVI